ncbi:hypothetical protein ACFVR6_09065 [Microbacterium sp. NPDC058021]
MVFAAAVVLFAVGLTTVFYVDLLVSLSAALIAVVQIARARAGSQPPRV